MFSIFELWNLLNQNSKGLMALVDRRIGQIQTRVQTAGPTREYWMTYRGPGFLPRPPPPTIFRLPVCRRSSLLTAVTGEGSGRGAKSYDREKAWPSFNHPILSGASSIFLVLPSFSVLALIFCVPGTLSSPNGYLANMIRYTYNLPTYIKWYCDKT